MLQKPDWIRVRGAGGLAAVSPRRARSCARTASSRCARRRPAPTSASAGRQSHATIMIMGDTCTRACAFCNVKTGLPGALDRRRARAAWRDAVAKLGLDACRHHLGRPRRPRRRRRGAFRRRPSRRSARATPATTIEMLTPDFLRKDGARSRSWWRPGPTSSTTTSRPCRRSISRIRPARATSASLRLLQQVKELDPTMFTKSGIMVGLGEERDEMLQVMDDLRAADVDFSPSANTCSRRASTPRSSASCRPTIQALERTALAKGFLLASRAR